MMAAERVQRREKQHIEALEYEIQRLQTQLAGMVSFSEALPETRKSRKLRKYLVGTLAGDMTGKKSSKNGPWVRPMNRPEAGSVLLGMPPGRYVVYKMLPWRVLEVKGVNPASQHTILRGQVTGDETS